MKNILRSLVYGGQVSLTALDTTEIVQEAIKLHNLSPAAAVTLGKTLTAIAFASSALKEENGKISVYIKGDGIGGSISVSGDFPLHIRGYIENPNAEAGTGEEEQTLNGSFGAMTIVRDDGYAKPFVGSCALHESGKIDRIFETYYAISEQLPTYFSTVVRLNENGECTFAGGLVLQPLPFADEDVLFAMPTGERLDEIAATLPAVGIDGVTENGFGGNASEITEKYAIYQCHCSRAYLAEVLASLGETQTREIIKEDGAVKIHCHYCNTEYAFTEADADLIFQKKNK